MLELYIINFYNFSLTMYIATFVIYFYLISICFGVNCLLINTFKYIFFHYTLSLHHCFITNIHLFNNSHLVDALKIVNAYEESVNNNNVIK